MKRYKPLFENKEWITVQKLEENLRLSDLTKHAGISDFTKPFMKDRLSIKGGGNKSAILSKCTINTYDNNVVFEFRSAPTYPKQDHKKTLPNSSFELKKTPVYIQEIMIIGIFDWLDLYHEEGEDITENEIKDILSGSDIKVWCSCPSQYWQGNAYYLSLFDASIYNVNIEPKHWNKYHKENNLVCKHLDLLINSIDFFLNPMSSMLSKKLRENNYI